MASKKNLKEIFKFSLFAGIVILIASLVNVYYLSVIFNSMMMSNVQIMGMLGVQGCTVQSSLNSSADLKECITSVNDYLSSTDMPTDFFDAAFVSHIRSGQMLSSGFFENVLKFLSPVITGIVIIIVSLIGMHTPKGRKK